MLTQEALNSAIPLTTLLDSNNVILVPVAGTPLAALVVATRSDTRFNSETSVATPEGVSIKQYSPNVVDIEYIANVKDPVLNTNAHDDAMDSVVEMAANAVREHIVFAKSVVAPTVEDLVNRVVGRLSNNAPSTLLGMEVVVWEPAKPLLNSALENELRKYETLAFDNPTMNLQLPSLTVAEIIELMASGSGGLDGDIKEWAAGKGESFFINIWENVFQIKQAELNEVTPITFRTWAYEMEDCVDNALAIYLIARKIFDDPLPGTEMNLNAFSKTIVELRNQSAARLCLFLDEMTKIDRADLLIRSMTDRVTTVNGSVYAKWIEGSGENEILFGNLLQQPREITLTGITARAEELKGIWNRHATLISTVERNKLFTRTKEVLMSEFADQMRVLSANVEGSLANMTSVLGLYSDCLDDMREDELVDIWDACLKLLCASRFIRTEARGILLGIERVKKEHPHIEIREAAAISAIEYIADWVATQLQHKVI
jgi:hypothetical protein